MLYNIRDQNIFGFIAGCLPFISLFVFFNLKIYYKAKFLETLTKVLSVFLFISLIAWFLVMIGVSLPKGEISYEAAGGTKHVLNNYYLFIEYTENVIFQRFMSIFIEPGYLGSLLAFLIYINNFELKRKEVLVLFISLIITFSLAGYLMLLFSYLTYLTKNKKNEFIYLIVYSSILLITYNLTNNINNGNNIYNKLIYSRFEFDKEKDKWTGNNRTSAELDFNFDKFLDSEYLTTGVGLTEAEKFGGGVGYKAYIITNGIFGLSILFLAYLSGWIFYKKSFSFTIVMLYILMFLKGSSEIFWAGFLMIYASSIYLPENWRQIYHFNKNVPDNTDYFKI
jgi:hypothetical protein